MPKNPEIPRGDYCYQYIDGERFYCPYFATRDINGVQLPWCNFLQAGSVPMEAGAITMTEREQLISAWGLAPVGDTEAADMVKWGHATSIEEAKRDRYFTVPKEFDLFLLWDSCKECGQNSEGSVQFNHKGVAVVNKHYPFHTTTLKLIDTGTNYRVYPISLRIPKRVPATERTKYILRTLRNIPKIAARIGLSTSKVMHPAAGEIDTALSYNVQFAAQIAKQFKR